MSEFVSFAPLSHLSRIKSTFQVSFYILLVNKDQSSQCVPKMFFSFLQGDPKSHVDHLFSWESLIVSSVKEEVKIIGFVYCVYCYSEISLFF